MASSKHVASDKIQIIFSFNTTPSMHSCLEDVRIGIIDCARRLIKQIGKSKLTMSIIAHGDYVDAGYTYVTKQLPWTSHLKSIIQFVSKVGETESSFEEKCYELILHKVVNIDWPSPKGPKFLVMIGDGVAHLPRNNPQQLDWKKEVQTLKEMNVIVNTVQVNDKPHVRKFYASLARITGGVHLMLDDFESMVDVIVEQSADFI